MYKNDLPDNFSLKGDIAIDTEAMGLNNHRDRICLVQLSNGNGDAHLVKFDRGVTKAPNLQKLLENDDVCKIFHFGRFDIAIIKHYLGISYNNIYCTKIASKLARTYTESHGLKELCRELLGVQISKLQQMSNWGDDILSKEQLEYAASDVLYLHELRNKLNLILTREDRMDYAVECFKFLPKRVDLDLAGWQEIDIFAH